MTTTKPMDDGGPAFPSRHDRPYPNGGSYRDDRPGMSLRDYFAAKAMQGMISTQSYVDGDWEQASIAKQAYEMADAMIRARQEIDHDR